MNKEEHNHPAMGPKQKKIKTLEEETEEWNFCMDEADHQTMVRREMARIRKEWKAKGLKEEGVTDVHKIVHEAERRVSQMAKKDINKYDKDSHECDGIHSQMAYRKPLLNISNILFI